ncbi:hypothetical protein HDU98_011460, partial [Podochytrium sp. JEL0797]
MAVTKTLVQAANRNPPEFFYALVFVAARKGILCIYLLQHLLESKKVHPRVTNHKGCNLLHALITSKTPSLAGWFVGTFPDHAQDLFLTPSKRGHSPFELAIKGRCEMEMVYACLELEPIRLDDPGHFRKMCVDWGKGNALKVFQRVMKAKSTPDSLKQRFRAKLRMDELTSLLRLISLHGISLDEVKSKVATLSWWPTRLPWSPLEQAEIFWDLHIICAKGKSEVLEWMVNEGGFSIGGSGMAPGSHSLGDVCAMGESFGKDFHLKFNRHDEPESAYGYEGTLKAFNFAVLHWDGKLETLSEALNESISQKKGSTAIFSINQVFESNPWVQATQQLRWQERLRILLALLQVDSTANKSLSLPSLDFLVVGNNANILKALVDLKFIDLSILDAPDGHVVSDNEGSEASYNPDEDCGICLCPKRHEIMLDCGFHSFCKSCVQHIQRKAVELGTDFKCPFCRRVCFVRIEVANHGVLSASWLETVSWLVGDGNRLSKAEAALGLAAASGAVHVMDYLIHDVGVSPFVLRFGHAGDNLLHVAVTEGSVISINWLLNNGFSDLVTIPNTHGVTPWQLHLSIEFFVSKAIFVWMEPYLPSDWKQHISISDLAEWAIELKNELMLDVIPSLLQQDAPLSQLTEIISCVSLASFFFPLRSSDKCDRLTALFEKDRVDVLEWVAQQDDGRSHVISFLSSVERHRKFDPRFELKPRVEAFQRRLLERQECVARLRSFAKAFVKVVEEGGSIAQFEGFRVEQEAQLALYREKFPEEVDAVVASMSLEDVMYGQSVLAFAVERGNYRMVKEIMEGGLLPDIDFFDQVVRRVAGIPEVEFLGWCLDWMVSHDLDLNARTKVGSTLLLDLAVSFRFSDIEKRSQFEEALFMA